MWTIEINLESSEFPDYVFKNTKNSAKSKERLRICKYPNNELFTVSYYKIESTGKFLKWADETEWNYTAQTTEELTVEEIKEKYNLDI